MSKAAASKVFYSKHTAGVTVYVDGRGVAVSNTHPNYDMVLKALRDGEYDKVRKFVKVGETIAEAASKTGSASRTIIVEDGELVYINGSKREALSGPLADRIMNAIRSGHTEQSIAPLMMFIDNIMKNKLKDIRAELYEFMLAGKMPITKDGCFLAYKKVRGNYKDVHTGTMDNSPGKLVTMPPEQVDTNRHDTCSRGLHFCAYSYLSQFGNTNGGGERIVLVKVNPRFVFAIPTDYNNAKGRASEYFVVGEVKRGVGEDILLNDIIFDEKQLQVSEPKKVKFIPEPNKPSLRAMVEGYGLLNKQGKVYVRVADSKGALTAERYSVMVKKGKTFISALTGKDVPAEHVKEMSADTKSVRSALVRAVARSRNKRV